MREYLLERLDGEAALRHLRAGHGASARFGILLAERLTLPDGAKRRKFAATEEEVLARYSPTRRKGARTGRNIEGSKE
jgi:hypothetical protein